MTIELKPEQERILQEALRQGRFQSVERALDEALHSIVVAGGSVLSPAERAAAYRAWAESLTKLSVVRQSIRIAGR